VQISRHLTFLCAADPPKIEAFLAPPVNSHVAPKHKYEKKELKKEYFQCPCTAFHEDGKRGMEKSSSSQEKKDDQKEHKKGKVKDIFHVSQMKIATYRYMILYHQASYPPPGSKFCAHRLRTARCSSTADLKIRSRGIVAR